MDELIKAAKILDELSMSWSKTKQTKETTQMNTSKQDTTQEAIKTKGNKFPNIYIALKGEQGSGKSLVKEAIKMAAKDTGMNIISEGEHDMTLQVDTKQLSLKMHKQQQDIKQPSQHIQDKSDYGCESVNSAGGIANKTEPVKHRTPIEVRKDIHVVISEREYNDTANGLSTYCNILDRKLMGACNIISEHEQTLNAYRREVERMQGDINKAGSVIRNLNEENRRAADEIIRLKEIIDDKDKQLRAFKAQITYYKNILKKQK